VQVLNGLNNLESTGALQATNQMSINALLNPEGEHETMDESMDEKMYRVVIDTIGVCENIDKNSCDDLDSDGPMQTWPTDHEALQTAAIINRYIDKWDDPIAQKLEITLGSFNCELCLHQAKSMKSTVLTDYFSPY